MRPLLPCLLSMLLVLPLSAVAATHDHLQAAAPSAEAPAQRHATDAVLREEMQGIRVAVGGLDHYAHGHIEPALAVQLAGQVEERVRTIIAHCKLPPDADAALHTIIVPLMQNAGALKKDPQDLAAIQPMRDALAQYARQFDDPAFASP